MRGKFSALTIVAICVIVPIAVSYLDFYYDLSEAQSALEGRSQVLETDAGSLEFAEVGMGLPLFVIHGAGGGFDQSLLMAVPLTKSTFTLIAPSRFGYLRSHLKGALGIDAQADAYVELLDSLAIKRVPVIAMSAGSWSALDFAVRHPERCASLVLISPAPPLPPGMKNRGGALASAILHSDTVAWLAGKLTPVFVSLNFSR